MPYPTLLLYLNETLDLDICKLAVPLNYAVSGFEE